MPEQKVVPEDQKIKARIIEFETLLSRAYAERIPVPDLVEALGDATFETPSGVEPLLGPVWPVHTAQVIHTLDLDKNDDLSAKQNHRVHRDRSTSAPKRAKGSTTTTLPPMLRYDGDNKVPTPGPVVDSCIRGDYSPPSPPDGTQNQDKMPDSDFGNNEQNSPLVGRRLAELLRGVPDEGGRPARDAEVPEGDAQKQAKLDYE
eukprot:4891781-Heterocapsa_arctica.AAC.1